MPHHWVRYSQLGQVGLYASADAAVYPRDTRVVLRTSRGLELGRVLSAPDSTLFDGVPEGQILRRMTVEDDLLAARLEKYRHEAFDACNQLLVDKQISAVLVDVEHLFDGEGLFFYFLGDVPAQVSEVMEELSSTYEMSVEFRRFAETLSEGCGPGCGTEEAKGQGGCDSCVSCAVASACGSQKSHTEN